jgi:hypothetical protein
VEDNEASTESTGPAPARRRAPAKRRTSARKAPARRKAAPRPRSRASKATRLTALLDGLASTATAAGRGVKTLSGQGSDAARRAMKDAGAASRKTFKRLTKEWESMDNAHRAKFVAALLAALAAASAPMVRAGLKKK